MSLSANRALGKITFRLKGDQRSIGYDSVKPEITEIILGYFSNILDNKGFGFDDDTVKEYTDKMIAEFFSTDTWKDYIRIKKIPGTGDCRININLDGILGVCQGISNIIAD